MIKLDMSLMMNNGTDYQKVITTIGPRKPQRQSSNANSSITSEIIDTFLLEQQQQPMNHREIPQSPLSPSAPHKICLETSFTSLQSPIDPIPPSSSKASSINGSQMGTRSQLSSIIDDSGIAKSLSGPSEATTVILVDPTFNQNRAGSSASTTKTVNFSTSPNLIRSEKEVLPSNHRKPVSLSWNGTRQNSIDVTKIDLIHDDWFGLAPLASPESLSELSSISSRASIGINLGTSVDKFLEKIVEQTKSNPVFDSQMHTPKIMRRTPKIDGNLSKCGDDWKLINSYKRMGKIFITNPINRVPSDSDSTVDSYESAANIIILDSSSSVNNSNNNCNKRASSPIKENSKSADNLDDFSVATRNQTSSFTVSDSAILNECSSDCPACPCRRPQSTNVDCCKKFNHRECYKYNYHVFKFNNHNISSLRDSKTTSSSDTYHSAMSSLTSGFDQNLNGTKISFNGNTKSGILESHFPVYPDTSDEKSSLLSNENSPKFKKLKSSLANIKRNNDDDYNAFSRNESLPLLANLVEKSSPTNYVRKKHSVYPMGGSGISISSSAASSSPLSINNKSQKNESNV